MKKIAIAVVLATIAAVILLTLGMRAARMQAAAPDQKVAVFGRTLFPTPPPMIQKRTHPSGEGVFIRTNMDK